MTDKSDFRFKSKLIKWFFFFWKCVLFNHGLSDTWLKMLVFCIKNGESLRQNQMSLKKLVRNCNFNNENRVHWLRDTFAYYRKCKKLSNFFLLKHEKDGEKYQKCIKLSNYEAKAKTNNKKKLMQILFFSCLCPKVKSFSLKKCLVLPLSKG